LFVDGARLGYGLMSPACDMTMADLAANCDAFYIGGTKLGFLFGEALVITDKGLNRDFRYFIKHHGAMLAKGRLLGVQFGAAFKDGLYYDMAKNAIDLAMEVKKGVKEAGFEMLFDSYTNQQYVIMPDETVAELEKNYAFALWCKPTENTSCIRICTSWATKAEDVKALLEDIRKLSK
ncbi:MAG: low specificity L-threonine aldolase, partial [Oscillospiraceae bacterium]|nr:low specificity L-threonine aldolase [Oscillospiraceae bacterium]